MVNGNNNLPSPPPDDAKASLSKKNTSSSSKPARPMHRVSKQRGGSTGNAGHAAQAAQHHAHVTQAAGADSRHKRVWKACERCRMKKTKCDGEFPCKRCKEDGLICTAGVRKKMEYKQLPKGYAEVLEHTQFALVATVRTLYSMVRNKQEWSLKEPEVNDRGQPIIHNIANMLGAIRPNSDADLPPHTIFPEDDRGMRELAKELERQEYLEDANIEPMSAVTMSSQDSSRPTSFRRGSTMDPEYDDYRAAAFGNNSKGSNRSSVVAMSPQSFTTNSGEFDFAPSSVTFPPSMTNPSTKPSNSSSLPSPAMPQYTGWNALPRTQQPPFGPFPTSMGQTWPQPSIESEPVYSYMKERLSSQGFLQSQPQTDMINSYINDATVFMGAGQATIDGLDSDLQEFKWAS